MRKRYKIFLISFIAILSCTFVRAQQHYTTANGLPSNEVYNSFRDSKGYIWFGTDKGVCRFDGKSFRIYTLMDGIADNSVINFFEDKQGRLWLFSYNGGNCFIYNNKVHNATNDPLLKKMPVISFARTMCNGDDSAVYIGYNLGTAIKVKDTTISVITTNTLSSISAISYQSPDLHIYSNTEYSVFRNDSFLKRSSRAFGITFCEKNTTYTIWDDSITIANGDKIIACKTPESQRNNVIKLLGYDDDRIFLCTHSNLILLNFKTGQREELMKGAITSVCKDVAGNFWVTTLNSGIYQLNRELNKVRYISNAENNIIIQKQEQLFNISADELYIFDTSNASRRLIMSHFNNYWAPICLVGNSFFYSHIFTQRYDLKNKSTQSLEPSLNDKAIPCTNNLIVFYLRNFITNMHIDGHTNSIVETKVDEKILRGTLSKNGYIYFLTSSKLLQFNPYNNEKALIDTFSSKNTPIGIYSFDDHIAVATNNGDLVVYTCSSKRRLIFGLKGLSIFHLFELSHNKFIVATNSGYLLLNSSHDFSHISFQKIVYPFNGAETSEMFNCGNYIVCNVNGSLYSFSKQLINKHTTVPIFFLDKLLVNGHPDTAHSITVNSTNALILNCSLSALYFGNSNIRYRFRINNEKGTGKWVYSNSGDFAIPIADYGDHNIEIQAVSGNDITAPSKFINVKWNAPFYLSWWFFLLIALLIALLFAYVLYLDRIRRKHKFSREMDLLQLEHKAINSLLNPHFVFNAINNIQNLVNKYRVDDANEYLARLSRLIRQNIENLQFNLITADKELSLIRNYIYLQNLRFNDKIHLQINNTADTDKLCLPPLLIHTFVENSVVHGFSPDIKDFTITIDIHPDGKDYVAITI
ncbi:MAG: histidine kinase, partial [Flavipsychrobacter sp.]